MEKTARKPSTDPVQEKLRQNKANWNKEVSSFINDIIHYKKLLNGQPSKYNQQKSRIIDPIPADPATIVSSLASDFQNIASRANAIVQEQISYSKTRKQKRQQQATQTLNTLEQKYGPEATPSTPDLSKQLGAETLTDYNLVSEASNPLTRFFSQLLHSGLGVGGEKARIRKYRMSLLNATLQLHKDLKKIQSAIVGSGPQSIFVSSKLLDKAENNYVFLASGIQTFKQTLPQGVSDAGGEIEVSPDQKTDDKVSQAEQAVKDIQANNANFIDHTDTIALYDLAKQFYAASPDEKKELAGGLLDTYNQVLAKLSNKRNIPVQKSLRDILVMGIKNPTASADNQLQIVAQNILGKWKHQISPFDKTSAFRLDVYNLAGESRKLANNIMSSLEKDLDVPYLMTSVAEIGNNLMKLRNLMQGLTSTIKGVGYQPQFLNMLESGNLGDYGVPLDQKQRADLEKMLKQKQMRDITKMYGKR